jgi:SAM-dependent methyltransferase
MSLTIYEDVFLGKQMSEHYTDFTDQTLVDQKPVKNWPCLFGQKCADVIKNEFPSNEVVQVLVVNGGVGRTTLELLRNCTNLQIDHTDQSKINFDVLETLLSESKIQWHQQLEGLIVELNEFQLDETRLLSEKNNSITFWETDHKNLAPELQDYDVIVADFRLKNSAQDLNQILKRLKPEGLLILGSIDDVADETEPGPNHSLKVLKKFCSPVSQKSDEKYPHIYRQTRNKHQYAISHFSVWRKNKVDDDAGDENGSKNDFEETITSTADYYEARTILESYDRFHFGRDRLLGVENFPLRMAEVCIEACTKFNSKMETGD